MADGVESRYLRKLIRRQLGSAAEEIEQGHTWISSVAASSIIRKHISKENIMSQVNIFEQATRKNIRWITVRGSVIINDLWTMPLVRSKDGFDLDTIAIALHNELETQKTTSFVDQSPVDSRNELVQLRFDIVKHIIDTRLAEHKLLQEAHAKARKKDELMTLLEMKQKDALSNLSEEDLRKMISEL